MRPTVMHAGAACASTSARECALPSMPCPAAAPFAARPSPPSRRSLPPVCVTNQGKEMRVPRLLAEEGMSEDDYIIADPINPVPNPHLGPLERQVSTTFEEGLLQEEVDQEAMNFWFTEPAQGWSTEKRRLRKAEVVPTDASDELRHPAEQAAKRRPLSALKAGDILQGTVVKQLLLHGFQIDVGFEADGLIWVCQLDAWRALGDSAPEVGKVVDVVVHAVRDEPLYRFPLQLMPTDATFASRLPDPAAHRPPLDMRSVKLSEYPAVAARTGRVWKPMKVTVPFNKSEDEKIPAEIVLSEEMEREMDDVAAGFL